MNHSAKILPHSLLTGSIGWVAGVGQAGSACIPFITGAIASKAGIVSLQPVYVFLIRGIADRPTNADGVFNLNSRLIGMMGAMFALWFIVPRKARHID